MRGDARSIHSGARGQWVDGASLLLFIHKTEPGRRVGNWTFVYQRRRIFMRNFAHNIIYCHMYMHISRYITIWSIIYALHCLLIHFSSNAIYSKLYNSLYGNSRRSYQSIQLDWSDFCRYVEIRFYILFKMPKTKFWYRTYFYHNAGSFYLYR